MRVSLRNFKLRGVSDYKVRFVVVALYAEAAALLGILHAGAAGRIAR